MAGLAALGKLSVVREAVQVAPAAETTQPEEQLSNPLVIRVDLATTEEQQDQAMEAAPMLVAAAAVLALQEPMDWTQA